MDCPFCGNEITRCTISSDAGKVEFSLCCDVDLDLLDNYDVFAALPELLQQQALEQSRAEFAAYRARARKSAAFFSQSRADLTQRYGYLMKATRGARKCQSETELQDDSYG